MIVANARVVTFDVADHVLDSGSVEVLPDGTFGAITPGTLPGAPILDARGRLLMPALIDCHTHLYSTLARGIAIPGRAPRNFPEILRKLWWRLDRALDPNDIYCSALVGLVESAKCGVGTLVDHHSSPNACPGSLDIIEQAFLKVGLRGALCYETSDRNGARKAAEAIRENARFIEKCRARADGPVGAAFGLHASFTLSDGTLRECVEAAESLRSGFHVHIAEHGCDAGAVRRLDRFGALDSRTVAAHCLHVTAREMTILAGRGVNVVHNPQSNCNNAAGAAALTDLIGRGLRVGLGSDGFGPRLWDEFKTASHLQKLRTNDPRVGCAEAYAAAFRNNREIVRKLWGMDVGRIQTGARADFILLDYFPPTPLRPANVPAHLLFGISNAPLDSLFVNGRAVVRHRRCVTVDDRRLAEKAAMQTQSLWRRFEE